MTLKIPDWLDGEARENFALSLDAAVTGHYDNIFQIASYGYSETGSGGAVAGGCSQWFDQSEEGIVTTLTIPCADDGYLDTVDGTSFDFDSTTLRLGGDGTNNAYQTWFHFCGVEIPAGATIIEAYLTITESTAGETETTFVSWSCEDDDSATVPNSNADGQARTRTTENHKQPISSSWGYGSGQRRTANFLDLLQEVVDRAGWNSGNGVTFWADFEDAQYNTESGFIEIAANATTLTVKYTTEDVTELLIDCDGDGEWLSGYNFNDSDNTIRVGFEKHTFFHFSNVSIPVDSTILLGNVALYGSSGNEWSAGGFDFHLVDEDASDVITGYADGDSRNLTTNSITIEADLGWGRDRARLDINGAAVIQEVVDRAGWASGNQMQAIFLPTDSIGDSLIVDSIENGSGLKPQLRIMYVKLPYEETVSGGVVIGGESAPSGSSTVIPAGGVLLGSSGDVSQRSDINTDGGILLAGSSLNTTSMNELTTGGVIIAGEARVPYLYVEEASGGLVVSQPMYENGFTHRTSVTVPAGSVASDMVFYLGVRLDLISDEFLITDLAGNVQAHEVREITETDTCLFWRCQLESEQDNVFLVYFNLEGS